MGGEGREDVLGLVSLLCGVLGETLLLELLSFLIDFLIGGTEEIDIIVVLLSGGSLGSFSAGRGGRTVSGVFLGGVSGKSLVFGRVGLDVLVPASGVRVLRSGRSGRESLEDSDVGLRGSVTIIDDNSKLGSV